MTPCSCFKAVGLHAAKAMMGASRIYSIVLLSLLGGWLGAYAEEGAGQIGAVQLEDSAAPELDLTAAKIVELHLKARGGAANLRSLNGYILHGTAKEGTREYELVHYFMQPHKYRKEIHREELDWRHLTVYASDGNLVWAQEVKPELKPAAVVDETQMSEALPEYYLLSQLLDWKSKGHRLTYVGQAVVAGAPTYIVKAELKDGGTVHYYFDKKHFLLRNVGFQREMAARTVDIDRFSLQWKTVGGVRFETAYELRNRGELLRRVEYDSVEVNPELDETLFEMPNYRELWLRQTGQGSAELEHWPELGSRESPAAN